MLDNGRRLQILKFMITGTKDMYSDMYQRNYVMAPITYKSLTPMADTIIQSASLKGGFIKPIDVATKMGNFLHLDANIGSYIDIPNGWSTERLRFLLIVKESFSQSKSMIYVIQGYTNYAGTTTNGALDPNMEFHFNSVMEYSAITVMNPYTGKMETSYNVPVFYNLLQDKSIVGQYTPGTEKELIRPKDIHLSNYYTELEETHGYTHHIQPINVGVYNNHELETSHRGNNDKSMYFTTLMNSYNQARSSDNLISHYDLNPGNTTFESAKERATEPELYRNPFFRTLKEYVTGMFTSGSRSYYTYQELLNVFPDLDYCKQVLYGHKLTYNLTGDLCTLNTPNVITAIMTEFTNSLSTMLVHSLIQNCSLQIRYIPGQPQAEVLITSGNSILEMNNLPQMLESFKSNVSIITIPSIFGNHTEAFEMSVYADLFNDTTINYASLHHPNQVSSFLFPTFADSLYSNVIASKQDKVTLSTNVKELITAVDENVTRGISENFPV